MYSEALKYKLTCTYCGKCCTNGTESSCTFLYIDDINRISNALDLKIYDFLKKYTNIVCYQHQTPENKEIETFRITLKGNPTCIFLKNNLCSINDFKPFICRYGPFLQNILNPKKEWDYWLKMCNGLKMENISLNELKIRQKKISEIKRLQDVKETQYFEITHYSKENNIYKEFITNSDIINIVKLKI